MTVTGTAEETWTGWPVLEALRAVDRPSGRVVVISAHPDDEVLGAGGLVTSLAGTATTVAFVTVTDGEASHRGSGAMAADELAQRRSVELLDALTALGHPDPDVTRLRLPDSDVAAHVPELTDSIARAVCGADLVVCPAVTDGHIDHATVGLVTRAVCAGLVPVWEFPIWLWHWTAPGDAGIPWERARRYPLSTAQGRAKQAALGCFVTQVRPLPGDPGGTTILPPDMLAHFTRRFEVFFT